MPLPTHKVFPQALRSTIDRLHVGKSASERLTLNGESSTNRCYKSSFLEPESFTYKWSESSNRIGSQTQVHRCFLSGCESPILMLGADRWTRRMNARRPVLLLWYSNGLGLSLLLCLSVAGSALCVDFERCTSNIDSNRFHASPHMVCLYASGSFRQSKYRAGSQ